MIWPGVIFQCTLPSKHTPFGLAFICPWRFQAALWFLLCYVYVSHSSLCIETKLARGLALFTHTGWSKIISGCTLLLILAETFQIFEISIQDFHEKMSGFSNDSLPFVITSFFLRPRVGQASSIKHHNMRSHITFVRTNSCREKLSSELYRSEPSLAEVNDKIPVNS